MSSEFRVWSLQLGVSPQGIPLNNKDITREKRLPRRGFLLITKTTTHKIIPRRGFLLITTKFSLAVFLNVVEPFQKIFGIVLLFATGDNHFGCNSVGDILLAISIPQRHRHRFG